MSSTTARQRKNSEEITTDVNDHHDMNNNTGSTIGISSASASTSIIGSSISAVGTNVAAAAASAAQHDTIIIGQQHQQHQQHHHQRTNSNMDNEIITKMKINPTLLVVSSSNDSNNNNTRRRNNTNLVITLNQYIDSIQNSILKCKLLLIDTCKNKIIPKIKNITIINKKSIDGKKIVSFCMIFIILVLIGDTLFSSPNNRIVQPNFAQHFLLWVQDHPQQGIVWIILFMIISVIFMIPIGTPLTVGCGYIYKSTYGWKAGILFAVVISTIGSAIGAIICFLLGRYLMRHTVRKWIRKYPLFDAIDAASAEHGLRIMAMLYLTPIVPLGPISYMCGTTSMSLSSFIIAKIAAVPLMVLYVFIGASTGTLISKDTKQTATEVKKIEENQYLIIGGILLSFIMIYFISTYIKKELNKILERQQKYKPGEMIMNINNTTNDSNSNSNTITNTNNSSAPGGGSSHVSTGSSSNNINTIQQLSSRISSSLVTDSTVSDIETSLSNSSETPTKSILLMTPTNTAITDSTSTITTRRQQVRKH